MESIDFVSISEWLKTTIPGIVLLGAFGSVAGVALLTLLNKVTRTSYRLVSDAFLNRFLDLFLIYVKAYLSARSNVFQLKNKSKDVELLAYYIKVVSEKRSSSMLAWLSFFIIVLLFVITVTVYIKTLVFFIAIFFVVFHDSICWLVIQALMDNVFHKEELDFAKNTYSDEHVAITELDLLLKERRANEKIKAEQLKT
ncbi:TPA: hypothetical protein ACX3GA_004611 [Vibrio parahaemolyticus]|uniref:hypothetical protein n=1 Tax=Vibrio parahaemolyticus TaxID=670 RepID=UPI00226A030C|nr:hypothetical protein [Vibrio parahaemolyticus]MCX8759359.1 hypothetical protein [Vibrio parahaemolyticus]